MQPPRRLLLAVLLATPLGLRAAITFNFTYQDVTIDNGLGFDHPTLGATRRATVEAVGDYLNTVLVGDGTADIHWNVSLNDSGSGVLGSMSPYYPGSSNPAGYYSSALYYHAIDGFDLTGPALPDGQGIINFGHTWNSELDAPTASEFDLFTVVLHETVHGFGFASLISETGGYDSPGLNGIRTIFDSHLHGPSGKLLDANGVFVGDVADLTSDSLTFRGPAAMAANGGQPVAIYSPALFREGSSISHTDFSVPGVMNPALSRGVSQRSLTSIEQAMLSDLAAAAVPEPREVALALGTGLVLYAVFRRRNTPPAPCARSGT